jgi:replicative DNA helicase
MDGRTVPYDLSAERAVLGAILLDREAILAVRNTLPYILNSSYRYGKLDRVYELVKIPYW